MNTLLPITDLINPQDGTLTFEQLRHENGSTYWLASELRERLGYGNDAKSFYKAIKRATSAIMGLGIDPYANIQKIQHKNGAEDYKLTRFASYLIVMNADTKKPEVAASQFYFVSLTRQFELWLENPNDVSRVAIRHDIKEQNKQIAGTAKKAGVTDFARFQNAGYLGMYNMMNVALARHRGIDADELLDYMGSTEMAANLFRIEMTKSRLELEGAVGQSGAERIHREVGNDVRQTVIKNTGVAPENLSVERRLPDVERQLKIGHKEMKKIDRKKKK